ncbi:MAG: exo-beta-N-acetylmuramidase NamZ domain-containing protein [Acidobacteriota bacterium]
MKKILIVLVIAALIGTVSFVHSPVQAAGLKLGDDRLVGEYHNLIVGKRVGLVTNQTGVNSQGQSIISILAADKSINLNALYGPEHGIDGKASAGAYVKSYTHPTLKIPVYSLYGDTRMPTAEMLKNIDVLVFDIQDIGARSYTFISTLNYCMVAAQKYGKAVVVLDRPNPVGGTVVDGPVLEEPFKSFVGIDNLPVAHGMTAGELAKFYNRKIGANLTVVPMEGYERTMIWQDTGLRWVQSSPMIPDIDSVFGYMATGMGEGTGIFMADYFKWVGGKGIDSQRFASLMNSAGLPGVQFVPEKRGSSGGVRLKITDYHTFDPARTGFYALGYAHSLIHFKVPKSGKTVVMFDKIMGTNKIGQYLEQGLTPQQIEAKYASGLNAFKNERGKYLIYGGGNVTNPPPAPPKDITVQVNGSKITFDVAPYIDKNSRVMVPLRAIAESLGADAMWDNNKRQAIITKSSKRSVFTIGSSYATYNGVRTKMDTYPVIRNGRTMMPARFVVESVGASTYWVNETRTVVVNSQ